jgi:hypothetical protein
MENKNVRSVSAEDRVTTSSDMPYIFVLDKTCLFHTFPPDTLITILTHG